MNMLLIVVGIIFLVSIIVGYKKGFLKIALSLVTTIVAIGLVLILTPHISGWIQKATPISENVQGKLQSMIGITSGAVENEYAGVESSREQQISLIKDTKIPSVIQDMLLENNNNEVYEALGVTSFVDYIGAYITKLIADVIAFLAALVVAMIILRIVMGMVGIIGKIPIIGGINRIAGGIVGIGVGFIIVWILFILVTLLYNTSIGQACMEDIAANQILMKLYDGNILMNLITKF